MKTTDKKIKTIALRAFPEYSGRRFFISYVDGIDTNYNANWDEGSKTDYKFVRLDNGAVFSPPDTAPWNRDNRQPATVIPQGAVCVTHSVHQGHDGGLTVFFPKSAELEVV